MWRQMFAYIFFFFKYGQLYTLRIIYTINNFFTMLFYFFFLFYNFGCALNYLLFNAIILLGIFNGHSCVSRNTFKCFKLIYIIGISLVALHSNNTDNFFFY